MDAEEEPTQMTQTTYDARRTGSNVSSLSPSDISDIICILSPCTPAAFRVVTRTAAMNPQHVLQAGRIHDFDDELSLSGIDEEQTFIVAPGESKQTLDLALRFSSHTISTEMQFIFGRNPAKCDFVLDSDANRRVSNVHFRVYINESGVCMVQDMSTNGTLVDGQLLQGRSADVPRQRMISSGSQIQTLSGTAEEMTKFYVRIPSRSGHEQEYTDRFNIYMDKIRSAEARKQRREAHLRQDRMVVLPAPRPNAVPAMQSNWGMRWNGGTKYNITGQIGRGAFATVYQLATKADGHYLAAKELEKRKFMKHGVLDRKLDNELIIMKALDHPHIVKFVDYHDHDLHLYIIMEYVAHGDLQQHVMERGPLPEETAKSMAAQIFEAMAYLNTKRVTHRDIKPDNILLANNDPANFFVKLSDFGLSKVVQDNETFLKTFCGTLLYCAPEVFPHYGTSVKPSRTRKRTRNGQSQNVHTYSQAVDIWSFGAVLWFALCGKTPFEGIVDANGKAMFERIMHELPDVAPLKAAGVGQEAIDLLMATLSIDPEDRPTPQECLQYPWFKDLALSFEDEIDEGASALGAISEEEEDFQQNFEHDLSQLRIREDGSSRIDGDDENESPEHVDPRQSKRFKLHSADEYDSDSAASFDEQAHVDPMADRDQQPMLFGEITASILNQQNVTKSWGPQGNAARAGQPRPDSFTTGVSNPTNSLGGAEALVRDLNMDSPPSAESAGDSRDPRTPPTPEERRPNSYGYGTSQDTPTKATEITPRPAPFHRRIDIPLPAAYFYDPGNPSTHTPEYAALQSGHDFVNNPLMPGASFAAKSSASIMPPVSSSAVIRQSLEEVDHDDLDSYDSQATRPRTDSRVELTNEAARLTAPALLLGQLVTTEESFTRINIPLRKPLTLWGRAPSKGGKKDGTGKEIDEATTDEVIYEDGSDSRVPRRGIIINFDGKGLRETLKENGDLTLIPNLRCTVATDAKGGIQINGVRLPPIEPEVNEFYGVLAHGDIITICDGKARRPGKQGGTLAFKVDLYHGIGKNGRKSGETFRVEINRKSA